MKPKIREIALGEIEHLHPALANTGIEIQNLLPADVLTLDGLKALVQSTPIPVARNGASMMALGESRLLVAARIYLGPQSRIVVLDWSDLDSEATEAVIWSRAALHPLYTAHHPRGYPAAANAIRGAIPDALRARWCPSIASERKFANVTGISRNTLGGSKKVAGAEPPEVSTPLDRIRRGIRRD